jgi:EcsC protein family
MTSKALALIPSKSDVRQKVGDAILDLVLRVPPTTEQAVQQPQARAQAIGRSAARQASMLASTMALPPGFFGWLTVLPELVGVWKLQSQMVADIAGVYGKSATMNREQMVYCMFKHVSAQLMRDVVVRVGERFLIQRASSAFMRSVVQKLGAKVTQNVLGKSVSRFVPLLGAVGVGAYAYYDTTQVARTAMELFSSDIVVEEVKAGQT